MTTSSLKVARRTAALIFLILVGVADRAQSAFVPLQQVPLSGHQRWHLPPTAANAPPTALSAKKTSNNKSKNKSRPSTSGFGGAAAEACPCGSDTTYTKCCGKLHKNLFAFQKATPEQVVRARYTAYAKREIDFIIQSTHPMNEKFVGDIKHWREQIDVNCYDNFELTKCAIVEEKVMDDDKTATVCFVANMVQRDSRERTSFQETSTFERVAGAWLYKEGVIADPPEREAASDEEEVGDDSTTASEGGDEIEAGVEDEAEIGASPVVEAKIE
jgi:SEC-C motif-containing protein